MGLTGVSAVTSDLNRELIGIDKGLKGDKSSQNHEGNNVYVPYSKLMKYKKAGGSRT